jgi:LacI family transcriptional regulator
MIVKLKDIAKRAGVSQATVSLALNDSPLVRVETAEHIKELAKDLGYQPNTLARGLARRRSGTIGLVVPDIESAYYAQLIRHIDDATQRAGYKLLLAISNDSLQKERSILGGFLANKVEGVLIAPINKEQDDLTYLEALKMHGTPLVFTSAYYPGVNAPFVMTDLAEGTYLLVKYLLSSGHRKIAFLCGSKRVSTTYLRLEGYARAMQEFGLKVDPSAYLECRAVDYDQGYKAAVDIAARRPDAIITMNDMMALGVINALLSLNIRVPEDISVAGYDNNIFSRISFVPITTVAQDLKSLGRYSVAMLQKILQGEEIVAGQKLEPKLVIRQSTAIKK